LANKTWESWPQVSPQIFSTNVLCCTVTSYILRWLLVLSCDRMLKQLLVMLRWELWFIDGMVYCRSDLQDVSKDLYGFAPLIQSAEKTGDNNYVCMCLCVLFKKQVYIVISLTLIQNTIHNSGESIFAYGNVWLIILFANWKIGWKNL